MSNREQKDNFHEPLRAYDSVSQTLGCRHTNLDICAKNRMPKICAFIRDVNICPSPPASWPKQYKKLFAKENSVRTV